MDFYTKVTALSALAVVVVQQILKLKFIPIGFANRYPVPTLLLLSLVAAVVAAWQDFVAPIVWTDWVQLIATIAVVAAITYNMTLRNWVELRQMEGEK
jgi:hypothetical protein